MSNCQQSGFASLLSLFFIAACEQSPVGPAGAGPVASILTAQIRDNPNSVLSALISLKTLNAESLRVEIVGDSLSESTPPFVSATDDSTLIAVLGLTTLKTYTLRPVAVSSNGTKVYGPSLTYVTKPLPGDIPSFRVNFSRSPSIGYVLLGINPARQGKSNAVILDKNGTVVWYKQLPGAVFDFQKQSSGVYTAASSSGTGTFFYKIDNLGNVTEVISASNGLETGFHEFRMIGSDRAIFGVDYRSMDLSSLGGLVNAQVRGLVVEYHSVGRPPFFWNTFDHFTVENAASDVSLSTSNVNPWHGNAIDIDKDGNLIVSFRNSDEITKIDSRTGSIIWRLGGKENQFTFLNDPNNGFSHQHGVRRLANGNILMFDNGNLHVPQASRAVEYRINETLRAVEMVWEYRPDPVLFGNVQGSAQRLSNGNTLICFGTAQRIIEVDANGTKLWELAIEEAGRFAYRAFAVHSLY